jgi:hypothetical protein
MPSYQIPPDNRAVGTGDPPADVNELSDMEGLLTQTLAQMAGTKGNAVPGGNAANVTAVQAFQQTGYIMVTPWIQLPKNWFAGPWFTAAAAGFSSPVWILFDGDSVTNGVNPESGGYLATGWPDQLRGMLLSKYSASVYGDYYSIWSYTQTAGGADPVNEGFPAPSSSSQYEGGFGSCLTPGSASTWFQTISTGSIPGWTSGGVTGFDLVFYDYGACTWGFTIDGGEATGATVSGATWNSGDGYYVVTCSGGGYTGGNVKKVTVSGLTSGTHQIEYGQVSVGGNAMFIGISLYTGNSGGIGFVRSAFSGRRAIDSATQAGSSVSFAASLSAFPNDRPALWSGYGPVNSADGAQITPTPFGFPTAPTLAFVGYGINDCGDWINPDAYSDAIYRKIIAVRRGVPSANIALVAFSNPDLHNSDNDLSGNGNHYNRYKRVLADLAASYNCAYIDIDTKWGGYPVTQGFQESGNVHPTYAGATDIATLIAGIL